jgi:hypothetical protein
VRRPAAYYQHLLGGERQAAGAEEAARLRPLLSSHAAWAWAGSHGGHNQALLSGATSSGDGAAAAAEATASAGGGELLLAQGQGGQQQGAVSGGGGGGGGHDSAGLSQLRVHADDTTVTVGARCDDRPYLSERPRSYSSLPARPERLHALLYLQWTDSLRWVAPLGSCAQRGRRGGAGSGGVGRCHTACWDLRRERPTAGHTSRELLASQARGSGHGRYRGFAPHPPMVSHEGTLLW